MWRFPVKIKIKMIPIAIPSFNTPEMNQSETEDQETYDVDLPGMHSYLGEELEAVRGRTVFEDGAVVTLDLLQSADVVLMPGQTLPLTAFDPPTINMLRNCIRNDRTFGVLASWSDGRVTHIDGVGTTAEIYEYLPEDTASGFRIKARARQRFKLLESEPNRWRARVRILPEVTLPDPLDGVKLSSLNRLCSSPRTRQRCRRANAAVTRWPAFIYEQYSVQRLVRQIRHAIDVILLSQKDKTDKKKGLPLKVMIPNDPTELSFWVAQNLPMKEEQRVMMLKLNSPVQRLRWELRALQQYKQQLCCQFCKNCIGWGSDIFSMSAEGPQSTYVNPGGYLHETITLAKVENIDTIGHPSTEFSWFPGYAWTICKCKQCSQHLGWKFTASSLSPSVFWGICRRSITVNFQAASNNGGEDQKEMVI